MKARIRRIALIRSGTRYRISKKIESALRQGNASSMHKRSRRMVKTPLAIGLVVLFSVTFSGMPFMVGTGYASGVCVPSFTILGRAQCHGYFTNTSFDRPDPYDLVGDNVLNCQFSVIGCVNGEGADNAIPYSPSSCNSSAIPCGINDASSFENFWSWYLGGPTASYNYNHSGAAFVIDTMLGAQGSNFSNATNGITYAINHLSQWKADVDYYASQGWITWDQSYTIPTGQINSMHDCSTTYTGTCDRSNINTSAYDGKDFTFYHNPDDEPSTMIIFHNPNGSTFMIRRECANLVGSISPLVSPPAVTPHCGADNVDPDRPDTDTPYAVTSRVYYDNSTQAAQVISGGATMFIKVTGPGVNYSNTDVAKTQSGITLQGSVNPGPTDHTGTYNISYGISGGPVGAAITCSDSFTVTDLPYFSASGGDVESGVQMDVGGTNCATPADPHAGVVSWNQENSAFDGAGTQYAAYALNYLQDFASAQTTSGMRPSGLAFSNTVHVNDPHSGSDTYGGGFGSESSCVPDYYGTHPATPTYTGNHALTPADVATTGNTKTIYVQGGKLTIASNLSIPNGSHTVLYVDGDVDINNSIQFSGNYPGGVGDIPSFAVIANGNIYISKAATQLDGLYVAEPDSSGNNGVVYTCANGSPPSLDNSLYGNCNSQLTVNGSVIAKQVWLTRTDGTLYGGTPAEAFNFSPEVWLTNPPAVSTGSSGAGAYDAYTSLPPIL